MPDRNSNYEHYCIQAKRIESMDKKLDTITGHFRIDGIVGKMSGSIEKLTTLAENSLKPKEEEEPEEEVLPVKWLIWAIIGLIAILAGLLGIKLPLLGGG